MRHDVRNVFQVERCQGRYKYEQSICRCTLKGYAKHVFCYFDMDLNFISASLDTWLRYIVFMTIEPKNG